MTSSPVWLNWLPSPGAYVAQIARENGVNDNVIFKWLRL
uniref:Mobile element protein n=1 Tax=Klebsiella pneumoniae TaxID=573 RepID=A0A2H5BR12_KLEPN|nr:Mobile element protein [Klebsiella pneumoniae]